MGIISYDHVDIGKHTITPLEFIPISAFNTSVGKLSDYTIKEMMERYLAEVTPSKRGKDAEKRRLRCLLSEKPLMSLRLDKAEPHIFAAFRDRRIKDGVRACQYDLVLQRPAWNMARIE